MKRGGGRALVVDDHRGVATAVARYIGRSMTVDVAFDLPQAEALLAPSRYALALVDYHLPSGSGLDVIAALKRQPGRCLAFLITGDADIELEARAAGARALFWRKPISRPKMDFAVELARSIPRPAHEAFCTWLISHGVERRHAERAVIYLSQPSRAAAARILGMSRKSVRDVLRPSLQATGARDGRQLLQAFLGFIDRFEE